MDASLNVCHKDSILIPQSRHFVLFYTEAKETRVRKIAVDVVKNCTFPDQRSMNQANRY